MKVRVIFASILVISAQGAMAMTQCMPCEAGTYSNGGTTDSCNKCTAGNYCPGGSAPKPCDSGHYSKSGASTCVIGSGAIAAWKDDVGEVMPTSGTLPKGIYRVSLFGGDGMAGRCSGSAGGKGAQLFYIFEQQTSQSYSFNTDGGAYMTINGVDKFIAGRIG